MAYKRSCMFVPAPIFCVDMARTPYEQHKKRSEQAILLRLSILSEYIGQVIRFRYKTPVFRGLNGNKNLVKVLIFSI